MVQLFHFYIRFNQNSRILHGEYPMNAPTGCFVFAHKTIGEHGSPLQRGCMVSYINKNARLRCRAFCLRLYDFDYLSLLKSIRSFSSFEPLAFSNISRRCSTVRFFFSSPEISRIILPSLIIIRRLP